MIPELLKNLAEKRLLIITDYDGTLAPIVDNPALAFPIPNSSHILEQLNANHAVYILTGRPSSQVMAFLSQTEIPVVGLHGLEWPSEQRPAPDREQVNATMERLAKFEGLKVEDKGWMISAHYRTMPEESHAAVQDFLRSIELPMDWELLEGNKVGEFRPVGYGKGDAAFRIISTHPDLFPVFIGDDKTDEEAIEVVNKFGGVTVKVGPGETHAQYRLDSPLDVINMLHHWTEQVGFVSSQ